jgi:repressor LexA
MIPWKPLNFPKQKIDISPDLFGKENYFALRVRGDSMINAHIVDGDIAVIHFFMAISLF